MIFLPKLPSPPAFTASHFDNFLPTSCLGESLWCHSWLFISQTHTSPSAKSGSSTFKIYLEKTTSDHQHYPGPTHSALIWLIKALFSHFLPLHSIFSIVAEIILKNLRQLFQRLHHCHLQQGPSQSVPFSSLTFTILYFLPCSLCTSRTGLLTGPTTWNVCPPGLCTLLSHFASSLISSKNYLLCEAFSDHAFNISIFLTSDILSPFFIFDF